MDSYEKRNYRNWIFLILFLTIIMFVYKGVTNIDKIADFVKYIWKLLTPFIIGIIIAYIANYAVSWFENHPFYKLRKKGGVGRKKAIRIISILLVYVIVILLIVIVVNDIMPMIVGGIADIFNSVPDEVTNAEEFIKKLLINTDNTEIYNKIEKYNIWDYINDSVENLVNKYQLDNMNILFGKLWKGVVDITTTVINWILGLIIAFYLMAEKEIVKNNLKQLLRALFKDKTVKKIIEFCREADNVFGKFIVGKAIDSIIIGIICFIGLVILRIKYAIVISFIICITNMIPYFGPFIGAIPAVLITLFDSPIKAITVAIFILALQQFDGAILGPKILGDSVGLRPIWVMFAIIVGGGFFGILGMFLGVPVVAVLRLLILKFINRRIKKKEGAVL